MGINHSVHISSTETASSSTPVSHHHNNVTPMAADDDPGLSLAKLQIVDTTPPTLRCSDCHRLAVGAVKLPCCKANICHTCSVILYDTCPVCAHRSVTRGDCKPNKELREAVRAHRSTDREKYGAEHREEIERRKAEREKVERARAGREANRRNSGCIAAQREEEKRVAGKREQERRKRVGVSRRGVSRRSLSSRSLSMRCVHRKIVGRRNARLRQILKRSDA